jgi:DNA-binding response OmpR family regulator
MKPISNSLSKTSPGSRSKSESGPTSNRHPKRGANHILLVDDDPAVRDSLKAVLIDEGYSVISAENGQVALELAGRLPVDLVLLDLNMPVKNGWDTFEELTREHPLVPIVIVTARPNQLFTSLSAGAGALLEKPMDIPTLLQTIKKLLHESAELRLARLAGKETEFLYKPAPTNRAPTLPSKRPLKTPVRPT